LFEITGIIGIAYVISFTIKISINIFYFNIILIYKTFKKQL
jgi:hypothetical protein